MGRLGVGLWGKGLAAPECESVWLWGLQGWAACCRCSGAQLTGLGAKFRLYTPLQKPALPCKNIPARGAHCSFCTPWGTDGVASGAGRRRKGLQRVHLFCHLSPLSPLTPTPIRKEEPALWIPGRDVAAYSQSSDLRTRLHACMLSCFSRVWLFVTLWAAALQAPLSMGFSRQEYWSGLPCLPPGDLPNPGIKPESLKFPTLAGGFFTTGATWEVLASMEPSHGSALGGEHLMLQWSKEWRWGKTGHHSSGGCHGEGSRQLHQICPKIPLFLSAI